MFSTYFNETFGNPPFFTYLMDIILHQLIEAVCVKISWNISWITLIQSSQLSITENFKPIALPRRWRSDWVSWSLVAPHLYRALLASDPLRRCNNDGSGSLGRAPQQEEPEATDKHQEGGIDQAVHQPCKIHLGNKNRSEKTQHQWNVRASFGIFKGPQQKVLVFFFSFLRSRLPFRILKISIHTKHGHLVTFEEQAIWRAMVAKRFDCVSRVVFKVSPIIPICALSA